MRYGRFLTSGAVVRVGLGRVRILLGFHDDGRQDGSRLVLRCVLPRKHPEHGRAPRGHAPR